MSNNAVLVTSDVSLGQGLIDDVSLLADVYLRADPNVKKYTKRSNDQLLQMFVSRHYANASWELAHLLWAICHSEDTNESVNTTAPILGFFWLDEAVYPNAAKHWFSQRVTNIVIPETYLKIGQDRLHMSIREHRFELTFSRVNLLACLAEFIVNIQPSCIKEWQNSLWQQGLNAIRTISSEMQKCLYDYLAAHLPPVRTSKKYAYFTSNVDSKSALSAEGFIRIWAKAKGIEGLGRLNAFFDSYVAWVFARDFTHKYSENTHIDELETLAERLITDEESVLEGLQTLQAQQLELSEFAQKPKLLSKSQIEKLQIVGKFPEQCIANSGALLVNWTFSPVQASLVQALRNKLGKKILLDKLKIQDDYQSQLQFLNAVQSLNEQTMMACWQILRSYFPALSLSAFTLNNTWMNLIAASENRANDQRFTEQSIKGNSIEDSSMVMFSVSEIETALPVFMESCQKALKKNNRQGFTEQSLLPRGESYRDAIEGLVSLNKLLKRLTNIISKEFEGNTAIVKKYDADRSIIIGELAKRYVE